MNKREFNKLLKQYPYGSYCDVKLKGVISPLPKGYEELARKKFRSTPEKVLTIRLRTGKDDY